MWGAMSSLSTTSDSPPAGTQGSLSFLSEAGCSKTSSAVLQNAVHSPKGSSDCVRVD